MVFELSLASDHYWRRAVCRVPVALGKGSFALGKEPPSNPLPVKAALSSAKFRALGKGFVECRVGTRQRFDAVGRRPTTSNFFNSLPSATAPALGKEIYFF